MNFPSIIKKNFLYNFNKYISFYFVNSLIVAMLFMYGSLMFNPIMKQDGMNMMQDTIQITLVGIILFSVVFITYTNVAFIKNRGKEFGMYQALGMTTKDLLRIVSLENIGVMIAALITGVLTGALFGKLFYMALNRIIVGTNIEYQINYQTFILSGGVFLLVFLCNLIFNIIYIKKSSIITALKSGKNKEVGKSHLVIGFISLVLLIVAIICLPKTLFGEIFKNQNYMVGVFIGVILITPYMIIGSLISIVNTIIKKIPNLYNKNILVSSNLSHRFLGYKNMLYILTVIIGIAIFYVGFAYSNYVGTREMIIDDNPYDIMFVETEKYNKINENEIKNIASRNNAKIELYKNLEYLEVASFKKDDEGIRLWSNREMVISESNYNKHMDTNLDLKSGEVRFKDAFNSKINSEAEERILGTLNDSQLENFRGEDGYFSKAIDNKSFNKITQEEAILEIPATKALLERNVPFVNITHNDEFFIVDAIIIDDNDYEKLKNDVEKTSIKKVHLLNTTNTDKVFDGLIEVLKDKNNLDKSEWNEAYAENFDGEITQKEINAMYRPLYTEDIITKKISDNGLMFFTLIFVGLMFVIANGVVLYYKVLSDIEEEKERVKSLQRIGVTEKELKNTISKELIIIFFSPIVIGGGLGLYFLYLMMSNSGSVNIIVKNSIIVLIAISIIQFGLYLISRKKYIREIL